MGNTKIQQYHIGWPSFFFFKKNSAKTEKDSFSESIISGNITSALFPFLSQKLKFQLGVKFGLVTKLRNLLGKAVLLHYIIFFLPEQVSKAIMLPLVENFLTVHCSLVIPLTFQIWRNYLSKRHNGS